MAKNIGREPRLPEDVAEALRAHGIQAQDETSLREALEAHVSSFTLVKMMPAAARRWKARYRVLLGDAYHDAQSVPEAYARALLATCAVENGPGAAGSTPPSPGARE